MARAFSDSEAREIMLAAGFKPIVPYQKSSTPWKSKCVKCKKEVSPTLNNVKSKGVTCQYCAGNAVHIDDATKYIDRLGDSLFNTGTDKERTNVLSVSEKVSVS